MVTRGTSSARVVVVTDDQRWQSTLTPPDGRTYTITPASLLAPVFDASTARDASVFVLAPEVTISSIAPRLVDGIRSCNQSLAVLALSSLGATASPRMRALAHAGVDAFVDVRDGDRDGSSCSSAVALWVRYRLPVALVERLMGTCPGSVRTLAGWILRGAYRRVAVEKCCVHFHVDPRTLQRRLSSTCAPQLGDVIALSRLVHVALCVDAQGITEAALARRFGFPSDGALRMLVRRRLGTKLSQLSGRAEAAVTDAWNLAFRASVQGVSSRGQSP